MSPSFHLTEPSPREARSWLPLTPRGVAGFARVSWRRLLLVQFVFAVIVAGAEVWFLETAWFPTITAAIKRLPASGEIRSGRLMGFSDTPQLLAEGHFLAIAVDPEHTRQIRSAAHVQVEFGRSEVRFLSLFGYATSPYPAGRQVIGFNRTELEPWWGAWRPPILWLTIATVILWLLVMWPVLALIYSGPVWLIGFFANRDLNWRGSWQLACAALLPGALVVAVAMVGYGLGVLDLVQLMAVQVGHLVMGWIYAGVGPLFLSRNPELEKPGQNPFVAP